MARANGKVILLGEHAVVYGMPAIAAGIERGAQAEARPARIPVITIGDLQATAGDASELGRAFAALLEELDAAAVDVHVELEIPPGCGLGASAAIGVAVARAALEADASAATNRVLSAALAWERVFHGNPSGIDPAAAAMGGCISYVRGEEPTPLELAAPLLLAIAVAGPPASTRQMVEQVAALRQRDAEGTRDVLEAITGLVGRARAALAAGDLATLGSLLDENHRCLGALQVSTPDLDRACEVARTAGALGAKLTGAGGGGAVVALVDDDPAPILAAWRDQGFDGFATMVNGGDA